MKKLIYLWLVRRANIVAVREINFWDKLAAWWYNNFIDVPDARKKYEYDDDDVKSNATELKFAAWDCDAETDDLPTKKRPSASLRSASAIVGVERKQK